MSQTTTTKNTTLVNKEEYIPSAGDVSHKAAKRMDEQAKRTDSKAVKHAAALMRAQNDLMVEKDLAERFSRISALLKKVKTRSPRDYDVMQRQVSALKPLLRLSIESSEFRSAITKLIKTMELVFERKDKSGSRDKLKTKSKSKRSHSHSSKKRRSSRGKKSSSSKSPRGDREKLREVSTEKSTIIEQTIYVAEPILDIPFVSNATVFPTEATILPMGFDNVQAMPMMPMEATMMPMEAKILPVVQDEYIPNETITLPPPAPMQEMSGMSGMSMGSGFVPPPPSVVAPMLMKPSAHPIIHPTMKDELARVAGRGLSKKHSQKEKPMYAEIRERDSLSVDQSYNQSYIQSSKYHTLTDKEWKQIEDGLDEFFTLINGHPEYRKGVYNMFDLVSTFSAEIPNSRDVAVVNELKVETRDLIAQFAGQDDLQRLFDNMEDLAAMLDDNDEAQEWWDEFVSHFRKLCKHYNGRSDLRSARAHFDKADRIFYAEKKKIDKVLHLAGDVFDNLKNDEYVKAIKNKMSVLGDDLYYTDKNGQKHFDLNAVRDIAGAITDILKQELRSINLPDVEGQDKRGTFALRNLRVKSKFPAKIKFRLDSELVDHTSRKSGKTAYRMNFVLRAGIQHVESWANNIDFAFNSKGIKESGIMDVHIPTASLFIDFIFRPSKNTAALNDPTNLADPRTGDYKFVAVQSYFRIPDLVINYHKETLSHSFLVPLATKLYKRTLIRNLEAQVESTINTRAEAMGSQLANTLSRTPMPLSFSGGEKQVKETKVTKKKSERRSSGDKKERVKSKTVEKVKSKEIEHRGSPKVARHHSENVVM